MTTGWNQGSRIQLPLRPCCHIMSCPTQDHRGRSSGRPYIYLHRVPDKTKPRYRPVSLLLNTLFLTALLTYRTISYVAAEANWMCQKDRFCINPPRKRTRRKPKEASGVAVLCVNKAIVCTTQSTCTCWGQAFWKKNSNDDKYSLYITIFDYFYME